MMMNRQWLVRRTTGVTTCPGGYYDNGNDSCVAVGPGFFSPPDDGLRYPCTPGTFADTDTATKCTDCLAGSYSATSQATSCVACERGTYAIDAAAQVCLPCNDLYYAGLASDYAIFLSAGQTGQDAGDLYCLEPLQGPVYAAPTVVPTMGPTMRQTETPTTMATGMPLTDAPTTTTSLQLEDDSQAPTPELGTAFTTMAPTSPISPSGSATLTFSPSELPTTMLPPQGVDALQDVPPPVGGTTTNNEDGASATTSIANLWLPVFLALVVATALGLVVLWTSFEASSQNDIDERNDDDDDELSLHKQEGSVGPPRVRSDSASTLFVDEVHQADVLAAHFENEEASSSHHSRGAPTGARDLESIGGGIASTSSIWSLSVGLRNHYMLDDSSSDASKDDDDMFPF